jgi:hypothetical protein
MILLPKLTVIPVGFSGVRIDDFISLAALVWLLTKGRLKLSLTSPYVKIYLIFIGFQLISAIYNFASNSYVGLLFPVRLLELLVWYYVGLNAIKSRSKEQISRVLLLIGLYLSAYSFAEILGFAPKFGLFTNTNRVAVTMTGPFEYAVVIAILGFFIKQSLPKSITFVSLLLTQARVTIASTLFIYLFIWKKRFAAYVGLVLGVILIIFAAPKLDVIERFDALGELEISTLVDLTSQYYNMVSPAENSKDYFEKTHKGNTYQLINQTDASLELRLMRWMVILKTNSENISSILIGKGPGFYGIAVDGYYIRVFAETGLIGLLVFIIFLISLYKYHKKNMKIVALIVTMVFTGLFIDIFVSVKVMVLFWFLLGVYSEKHKKNKRNLK